MQHLRAVLRYARLSAVLLVISTACSSPAAEPSTACDVAGFTCTTLQVPLDHSQSSGKTLDLAVAEADNADAPRGVLLMLTGGPGQPGVPLLARVRTYLDPAVLREYRLVTYNQRGTGSRSA